MRLTLAALALCTAAPALAQDSDAATLTLFKEVVETPTVAGRAQVPALAEALAAKYRAAGWAAADVRVLAYDGEAGEKTAALMTRWRSPSPSGAKPILLLAHMDVVEAKRADWQRDPFVLVEEGGYLYGRGTSDNKEGVVGITRALLNLRAAGWQPTRDIIVFFTGDEETAQNGARLGASEWRGMLDADFALNSDSGGGAFTADGRPLGFGLQTAEKTYHTVTFTVRNKGGHSSRPRPDNAIYELATALTALEAHRFEPALNETTRAYFTARAKQDTGPLGDAMRAWLANPADGAAADAIEASELEVGTTRTRCVATRLDGGHADNALPQMARATVNCRILPGVDPTTITAELQRIVGPGVELAVSDAGEPTPASPLRPDVVAAYTRAVGALHPGSPVIPQMSTGATDGLFFRAVGIPVYGVSGGWGISPDDERAHGLDERLSVRSLNDNVRHWEMMLRDLAGKDRAPG